MINNISGIATIKEQVYTIIKQKILNGEYKPGDRILENNVSKELSISKSPIREALKELSGEGLVEILPNKGVFVKKLTQKDIIEILDFRMLIEKYSIRQVIKQASDHHLNELKLLYEKMEKIHKDNNKNEYAKVDAKFHDAIYKFSGNSLIYRMASNVFYLFQPFRVLSLNSEKRFNESLIEHKEIIDNIFSRDFDKAWGTAKKHLELANIEVINFLEKNEQIKSAK